MSGALAVSTSKAYASAVRSWIKFCTEETDIDADPLAPDEETLCFFVAWSKERGLSYRSAHRYLFGIRSTLLAEGIVFPPFSTMPRLERVLRGWKKETWSRTTKPRLPITTKVLADIQPHVSDSPRGRTIFAAAACGVYGILRAGEFTAATKTSKGYPRVRDLHRDGADHYRLHLPASKTDVFRIGVDVHIVGNGSLTCPIDAIDEMLDANDDLGNDGPLFEIDGAPLTRDMFITELRALLTAAGYDASKYSGHSLRKGGAQSLYEAGVPAHDIQTLGRWRSASFKLYIQLTTDVHRRYSAMMAGLKPAAAA
jgi:hypothetical protein